MKYNNFDNYQHWYNVHQYHFAHWCAFNMLAMNLGVWKFHHLFHDWYKPFMNDILLLFFPREESYRKVHDYHRTHSDHHLEHWRLSGEINLEDLVLDWECSGYTKEKGKLSAREYLEKLWKEEKISARECQLIKGKINELTLW